MIGSKSISKEIKNDGGTAFLIGVLKKVGPGVVKLMVVPVALYYFFKSAQTRAYSRLYFTRLLKYTNNRLFGRQTPFVSGHWFAYRHILSFSFSMIDRVNSWIENTSSLNYDIDDQKLLDQTLGSGSGGAVILVSHLGNFDLAIARRSATPQKKFNIVMDTSQTQTYNGYRSKLFKSGQIRFIEPNQITPLETINLVERVSAGEIVVIAADRIQKPTKKNSVMVDFLGDSAAFPTGPYVLSHLLEVPVFVLFSLKHKNKCLIQFELFSPKVVIRRNHRETDLSRYAQDFSSRLQHRCILFPLQWYNFYDFWAPLCEVDNDQT